MSDGSPQANLNLLQTFGLDVRQVRRARRMTMKGLGGATGYSESYVSRIEAAKHTPSMKFAQGADQALGTGSLFERQLLRILAGDHPTWFKPYIEMEQQATRIQDYSVLLIMGMLQTEEYARAVFRTGVPRESDDVIESRVVARIGRLGIMSRQSPPGLWVVLHEACLRNEVGGAAAMSRQLDHLAQVGDTPHVTLQVLPFSAGVPVHHLPFTLLEFKGKPSVVHADGPVGGRPSDDAKVAGAAAQKYDRLRADALSPAASADWFRDLAKEYADESRHTGTSVDQVQLQRLGRRPVRRGGPRIRPLGGRGSRTGQ